LKSETQSVSHLDSIAQQEDEDMTGEHDIDAHGKSLCDDPLLTLNTDRSVEDLDANEEHEIL
jgi:hypothetical protein